MMLTGDPITAERAAELGLVNQVSPPGQALAAAHKLAGRIAANAPLAVRAAKQVALQTAGLPDNEAFEHQESIVDPVRRSADAAEGARAFAEKRQPQWSGR